MGKKLTKQASKKSGQKQQQLDRVIHNTEHMLPV